MEITIIKSLMGLVAILGVLVFLLFLTSAKRKKSPAIFKKRGKKEVKSKVKTDFKSLLSIIKDKNTSTDELKKALDLVIKHHGVVHKKLGLRPHPDFDIYMDILFTICRHPNTDKNIIVNFDRALGKLNPEYKKEINDTISKGLDSRGY